MPNDTEIEFRDMPMRKGRDVSSSSQFGRYDGYVNIQRAIFKARCWTRDVLAANGSRLSPSLIPVYILNFLIPSKGQPWRTFIFTDHVLCGSDTGCPLAK